MTLIYYYLMISWGENAALYLGNSSPEDLLKEMT